MDSNMKVLLDEMKAMHDSVDHLQGSLTQRMEGVEKSLGDPFQSLESKATTFGEWQPVSRRRRVGGRTSRGGQRASQVGDRVVLNSSHPAAHHQ